METLFPLNYSMLIGNKHLVLLLNFSLNSSIYNFANYNLTAAEVLEVAEVLVRARGDIIHEETLTHSHFYLDW